MGDVESGEKVDREPRMHIMADLSNEKFSLHLSQYNVELSIILTTVILILFLYYRNAPEIKASSPYLGLTMFLGCYSLFVGAMVTTLSRSVIHDGVFFCNAPEWCLSLGVHLI